MSILSFEYLVFVALTFFAYFLFPLKVRWWVLLVASIVFYVWSGWQGAVYLGAVTAITYGGALGIHALTMREEQSKSKLLLAVLLTLTLGAMAFLKYAGFWVSGLLIPLGLSWFTFQSAGYIIDVYRKIIQPERNPAKYLLFLSFFPQMAQGPISSWQQLAPQLWKGHRLEPQQVILGFQLMVWGYFKKLVIADRLAVMTAYVSSGKEIPGWLVLFGAVGYMLRLYADFSGGMDVIRGTAKILGIDITENFRRPFFALSVADYWRRWHISLGAWFRSYLLYPLTTSRAGLAIGRGASRLFGKKTGRLIPSVLATLIIFFLIGIWHGASWNAALYGLYFGIVMCAAILLERAFHSLKRWLCIKEKHPVFSVFRLVRTWMLVMVAQFFALTMSTSQTFSLMGQIFHKWTGVGFVTTMTAIMPALEWWIVLAALMLLLAVDVLCERNIDVGARLSQCSLLLRWPVLVVMILAIVVFGCYGDGFDGMAFLYTQF